MNSGIDITEAREYEDVFQCSLIQSKLITVEEMRVTAKDPVRHEGSPSSSGPPLR
jgi:hypothetical protein